MKEELIRLARHKEFWSTNLERAHAIMFGDCGLAEADPLNENQNVRRLLTVRKNLPEKSSHVEGFEILRKSILRQKTSFPAKSRQTTRLPLTPAPELGSGREQVSCVRMNRPSSAYVAVSPGALAAQRK
jgi:hypothetical protein